MKRVGDMDRPVILFGGRRDGKGSANRFLGEGPEDPENVIFLEPRHESDFIDAVAVVKSVDCARFVFAGKFALDRIIRKRILI